MKINFQQKLVVLATLIGLVTILAWMLIIEPKTEGYYLTSLVFNAVAILIFGGHLFVSKSDDPVYVSEWASFVSGGYVFITFMVTFFTFLSSSSSWSYAYYLMFNITILAIALISIVLAIICDD